MPDAPKFDLALDRLTTRATGEVVYQLKHPFKNGTTHFVFEPLEFLAKLAALVPRPRTNLTRYHGILAPNAKYRKLVVPTPNRQAKKKRKHTHDAAVASAGISSNGISEPAGLRINAIAWFLSREWDLDELEGAIPSGLDAHYEPTWDHARGEFTWGLGLDEEYPRGQFNSFLAAAEAVSPGAWARLTESPLPKQHGLVKDVDFPRLALAEARWENGVLRLRLHPQNDRAEGQPTRFRVAGLDDPDRWRVEGEARLTSVATDLVVVTTIRDHRLTLIPSERTR